MYFVLHADILVFIMVIGAYFVKSSAYKAICYGCCLIPLIVGYIGFENNMVMVHSALEMADPEVRHELLQESKSLAKIPFVFGLVSSVILAIITFLSRLRNT